MQNIYERIDSNKRKSWILIIGFVLFFTLIGYIFTSLYDYNYTYLIFALGFSSVSSIVSFYHSDKLAISLSRAKPATTATNSTYLSVLQNIAQVASIPIPKAYVIPSKSLNAFATGRDPAHASIAVTQGLLDSLTRTELEGVVAHEVAHIKSFDTRLMTLVSVMVGTIAIVIHWGARSTMFSRGRGNKKSGSLFTIIGILLIILAPLVANLIKFAISRRREFYADAQGVKFTRQPSGLISALEKLSNSNKPLTSASPATAHMYISNPFGNKQATRSLSRMFSTHPPLRDRIEALGGM